MPRSSPNFAGPSVLHRAGDGLGLAQLASLLRRSWRWIAVPTVVAGLGAIAFVQVVPPRYTGEAKLLLESREAAFTRSTQERGEQVAPIDEQAVASQVQVVMSRDLAREAIRRLKLVGNAEFDPEVAGIGPVQRLLMMIGLAKNPLERAPEDRVLEAYFDRLLVYPAGKSRILTVEFRAKDPELAAQAANTIAELYITSLEAAKTDTARYASTWLGGNIETLRTRVAEAEAKVEAYRARNGLIGGGTASQPLSAQQLGELSTQLSQARTVKADLAGRAKLIKEMIKDGRAFEIPDVANNEIIRRTVEQRITLRGQLALEARTLLPAHPRIKELTAQIADLDTQIKATAERIVRTMENDARIAEARVESLSATVDAQRDVVWKGNSSEVQLRALEREAKAQREQLESYLSRYREASARDAESATPADARIVSRAVVPETPSFPKKLPVITLAVIMALLFSMGGVIARHLLTDPDDIRRKRADADAETKAEADGGEPSGSASSRFTFPEASPALARHGVTTATSFEPMVASASVVPAAAPVPAVTPAPGRFALDGLVARLSEDAYAGIGRRVLFAETLDPVETQDGGMGDPAGTLAGTLAEALAVGARTVVLDLNGPACGPEDAGLTDLVAGEAAFLDVIQRIPGSRLDRVQRGFLDIDVLSEEPEALEIALDALAQAYDWVLCRLHGAETEAAQALLSAVGGAMDTVVIASNREADDAELVHLFALAEASGASRILVARDRTVAETPVRGFGADLELRRSAA
ncbi:lipopolysaccharide biosynthesis protein [Methylobacterium sp. Leaf469]|uniref:GumC family protein n=1 Tax=unclassified Methylobacterium TaxID=2615210 RepID=UPI0006F5659C|nr:MULTISPECIES: GumC family protein [unclassified Methylobacterium]KQP32644.1 lipopolysaccharide biosynthesis protein [Methylobacterium sp. Leaf102]KQP33254.1 lipopolysaccharide biosynthesis protein [Methylobacterium sp. Leaf100]KQU02309.1 lipopolysaccharide biosynthesis protein [Methylobacterium sp. Leaf469]